jgi:hypothetical protein
LTGAGVIEGDADGDEPGPSEASGDGDADGDGNRDGDADGGSSVAAACCEHPVHMTTTKAMVSGWTAFLPMIDPLAAD